MEFIQTGDCMILAVYQDGEVRPLTWRQVAHLESPAIARWEEGVSKGYSIKKISTPRLLISSGRIAFRATRMEAMAY